MVGWHSVGGHDDPDLRHGNGFSVGRSAFLLFCRCVTLGLLSMGGVRAQSGALVGSPRQPPTGGAGAIRVGGRAAAAAVVAAVATARP